MNKHFFFIIAFLFNLSILNAQMGNTLSNPIVAGTFSDDFTYSNQQNTVYFTNTINRPGNDIYYKFTLNRKTEVTITHCGSSITDTYLLLMNASGSVIDYNDNSNKEQCYNIFQSYLKKQLDAGTYYVVSEGCNENSMINTQISGKVIDLKGDSFNDPLVVGTFSDDFTYSNPQNTANFTNSFTGKPTNDVFYKFTLNKKMSVTMKHCGSTVTDTYLHLLDASGNVIAFNDDFSGTEQCASTYNSYLKKELEIGTYYVVSEGYNQNGVIITQISGKVLNLKGDSFNDPVVVGTFSNDFNYSDTQHTANFTNQHTLRAANDIFYKFTLSKKMRVTMTHCGSALDTYMTLLDASGRTLATNDDYSGEGACLSSSSHSFIQRTLEAGSYYIVSEGYNQSGLITTNITGYSSADFNYPDIPDAYSPDPDPVGGIDGSFNVSPTGGATFSIPIGIPQGVGGMQPDLAIVYDSQSGNGVAGWGCNLSGISAITRSPKDIYHDGAAKGLTYLADDAYYLDGKRLIYVSGAAGQEGGVYNLESDPLTKVIVHGAYNATTANTWFEVQASDGMKYYYGNTASARQSYTCANAPRINAWHLDYVEDPLGNYMTYTYNKWSYFMYLTMITYGNNKNASTGLTNTITFNYTSRNDQTPFFLENVKGYMAHRLTGVTTKTGSNVHRIYELKYNDAGDGASTKFSRLVSVSVKNATGEALKPITLNWSYLPSFYESVVLPTVNAASSYPSVTFGEQMFTSGDFNGDGLTDIMGIAPVKITTVSGSRTNETYDTYAYVYYASLDNYGNAQFVTGQNYSIGASIQLNNWKQQKAGSSVIDFDGDGIEEFVVPNTNISDHWKQIDFYIYGNAVKYIFKFDLKRSSEMGVYATGDFNKDGKGDVIHMEKGHSSNKYPVEILGLNSGTTPYRAAFELTLPAKPEKMFVSDFNGDGLDDIMVFYKGGYTIFWNQGNGISTSTFTDSKKTAGTNIGNVWRIRSGDFNGDGLADFIMNETNEKIWYFALNNGGGTFSKTVACTLGIHDQDFTGKDDDKFDILVYDFDSDGKSDVVISKSMYVKKSDLFSTWGEFDMTYTYWMRSTGSALVQVAYATSTKEEDGLSHRYLTGDFNGDGIPDLMNYGYNCYNSINANTSPSWRIYKNPGLRVESGKVYSIMDSYGSVTNIGYASFANGGIYTKGTGSAYPMADYTVPIHAVKSVAVNNGAAGSITTNYQYYGLKAHLQGKGILGLASQKITDLTHGITTESGVKSWNTTFFLPASTYAKITVGGKTSEENRTMAIVDKGSKKYFYHPSAKTEKDLDGNTVTTTYKYNSTYGYPEEEKADFGNNMYKTVQYGNYILAGGSYKPQLITLTRKHTDDAAAFTKKTAILYDTSKGYQKQVIENQGAALQLTTDYTYDNVGNVLTSKESGSGINTPLTVNRTYDATSRFLVRATTTPASSVNSYTYDIWGNALTEKDETLPTNALTTAHTYDNWGKRISSVLPDGRKNTVKRGWNNNQSKRFFILTQETGQPWVKTWYDNKGREVLVETVGEKGMAIQQKTTYNSKGEVTAKQSQTGNLTTTESFTYDARGRVASSSNSAGQSIAYTYENRKVTTATNGRTYAKTVDAWGNIKSATDPVSSITYAYSSVGKPKSIATGGATFSMTYDAVGNQVGLTDPNAGAYSYTYDAAGRLTGQIDAKGTEIRNSYDFLGRLLSTTVVNGITTVYTYGTTTDYDFLRLIRVQRGANYSTYAHDKYGRILTEKRNVDGFGLLNFTYAYNAQGQLSSMAYPDNVQVNRQYDAYGNLLKVSAGAQAIWESTGATGTVYTSLLGGALTSTHTYNSQGLLTNLKSAKGSAVLSNMDYVFNGATGNLTSRAGMTAQAESFAYDNLDRLTTVKHGAATVMSMDYKPNGNINSKTGLGLYAYSGRPHAVTSVENTGKLLSANDQMITYTVFDKAASISEKVGADNMLLNITYGPDQQRWKTELKKNNILQKTIIFAGDYEAVTENGATKQFYYMDGGDGLAAVYVKQPGQTDKVYYVHADHLGSIVKLTDGNGAEVFKASYDAWGNQTITNNAFAFHRGYTGHEHLKEFGLINMNGRMYDPVLGRFLSPDPYVQMMDFSQNYNRYAYCLNNPLRFDDPTGEWIGIDDLFIAIAGFTFNYVSYGFSTGNWGWKAAGAGAMGAVSGWLGYNIGGLATGKITSATWNSVGGMAANVALGQVMPSTPVSINNHFSLSVSPGLGWGTSGLTGGINVGATYSNGDFNIGAGLGVGTNHWGWNASATLDGWGAGYGRTYYSASNIAGQEYRSQIVGTATAYFNHNSFVISNDALGDNEDRWRSNAAALNIGRYSVGTYIYTNWAKEDSDKKTTNQSAPVLKENKKGAWKNGRVHFAPLWMGYRSKNGQTTRIGYSHPTVQNLTQNFIHKFIIPTPYFLNYDDFRSGGYFYSGYNNPHSLWER